MSGEFREKVGEVVVTKRMPEARKGLLLLIQKHHKDYTLQEFVKKFKAPYDIVSKYCNLYGFKFRDNQQDLLDKIKSLHEQGSTVLCISRKLNKTPECILRNLSKIAVDSMEFNGPTLDGLLAAAYLAKGSMTIEEIANKIPCSKEFIIKIADTLREHKLL